jgi:FG-GAP-like repeat
MHWGRTMAKHDVSVTWFGAAHWLGATLGGLVLLGSGCGRMGDLDDVGFGTAGPDDAGDGDGIEGEAPGSGGTISESCQDGVLTPGEWCQIQPPEAPDAGIDPCSLSIADFDADGRPDLAVPNSDWNATAGGASVASILRGFGNGSFGSVQSYTAGAWLPVGLAVGDFDGDGRPDIATSNWQSQQAYVLSNQGGAMSFDSPVATNLDGDASSIAAGDMNDDGQDDLIVNTPIGIALLRGGSGGAALYDTLGVGTGTSMHAQLVDIDEDGALDLVSVVADLEDRIIVFHGAGDGSFFEQAEYPLGGDPSWVVADDLNMDGDLDLAIAAYEQNAVTLYVGNAQGGFSSRTDIGVCVGPQSVAIGDMNNDGANDFVVGCSESDTVQMWLQARDGEFELVRWWQTGARPVSVQVADLNLDGQLDIGWANQLGNTIGLVISDI